MLTTLYLGLCPRLCADPALSGRLGYADNLLANKCNFFLAPSRGTSKRSTAQRGKSKDAHRAGKGSKYLLVWIFFSNFEA